MLPNSLEGAGKKRPVNNQQRSLSEAWSKKQQTNSSVQKRDVNERKLSGGIPNVISVRTNKVIVVDEHPIVAEGLKRLLGPSLEIRWIAANPQRLFETVRQVDPEIVVLEMSLSKLGGLQVIEQLRSTGCQAKLVVFTSVADHGDALRAINLGASAYLLKSCAPDELQVAFKEVVAGCIYIASELHSAISDSSGSESAEMDIGQNLTPRQRDVLRLFAAGYSAKEVGAQLFISKRTAENHKAKIKRLLGVQSNAELVRLALRLGLANSLE